MDIIGINIAGAYVHVTAEQRRCLLINRIPFKETDCGPAWVEQCDPWLKETRVHIYTPTYQGHEWLRFFFTQAIHAR